MNAGTNRSELIKEQRKQRMKEKNKGSRNNEIKKKKRKAERNKLAKYQIKEMDR